MNDEGEQRMDDEWTKEEIMEDVIEYYKDKDRHMIELVGNLREENERLRKHKKVLDRLYKMADADPDWKELIDELWEMIE